MNIRKSIANCLVFGAIAGLSNLAAKGQVPLEKALDPPRLDLTVEVAARSREGYPAALRITLTNDGDVPVDLPLPRAGCSPEDGISFHSEWKASDPALGVGGSGCAFAGVVNDLRPLVQTVETEWIRLRQGEFLTMSFNMRPYLRGTKPGTVTYWIEYTPPKLKASEVVELHEAGQNPPVEQLETEHSTFSIR